MWLSPRTRSGLWYLLQNEIKFLFLPVVLWTIMPCTRHNMPNWGKSTADWILHAGEKNYDMLLLSKKFPLKKFGILRQQSAFYKGNTETL